jgi:hypothetical protein
MNRSASARPPFEQAELTGRWRVERVSGLLPSVGLRKHIGSRSGSTRVGPVPLALFRVRGQTLDYLGWPVRDELTRADDDGWLGRGLFFGREFCCFRLVRDQR